MKRNDFHHATYQKNCRLLRLALPYLETAWIIELVTTALIIPKTREAVEKLMQAAPFNSTLIYHLQTLAHSMNHLDFLALCVVVRGVDNWTIMHGELRKELKKMNLLKPKTPIEQNP